MKSKYWKIFEYISHEISDNFNMTIKNRVTTDLYCFGEKKIVKISISNKICWFMLKYNMYHILYRGKNNINLLTRIFSFIITPTIRTDNRTDRLSVTEMCFSQNLKIVRRMLTCKSYYWRLQNMRRCSERVHSKLRAISQSIIHITSENIRL